MALPLFESNLASLRLLHRGKVRDLYEVDSERLLIVQTDRLSAFDVVLPTPVPGKGEVLTALSLFWFRRLAQVIPNHLLEVEPLSLVRSDERDHLAGRAMVVRRLTPLPIEAIARGYLAGSGWKEYRTTGTMSGIALPPGLREADRLPATLFTPSTKAPAGTHDENISFEQAGEIVGQDLIARLRDLTLEIYRRGCEHAESKGIIIADTKFEFGLAPAGGKTADPANLIGEDEIVLIDEVLTPDSSRFWPRESYTPGHGVPSFDKQFVRDYLEDIKWNKQPPVPSLPDAVIQKTREKYIEAFRLLSGRELI